MPDFEGDNYDLEFPLNAYDKARLASVNAMRGNLGAAARTVFKPDELSPKDRTGMKALFSGHPLVEAVADSITNPFILIGLALSFRYPLKGLMADKVFKETNFYKGRASGTSGWTRKFGVFHNIFAGLDRVIKGGTKITERQWGFQERHSTPAKLALEKFKQTAGHYVSPEEQSVAILMMEGGHRNDGGAFKGLYGAARNILSKIPGQTVRSVSGPILDINAVQAKYDAKTFTALKGLSKDMAKVMANMHKETLGSASPEILAHYNKMKRSRHLFNGDLKKTGPGTVGGQEPHYWPHHNIGSQNIFSPEPVTVNAKGELMLDPMMAGGAPQAMGRYNGPLTAHMMRRSGIMIPELRMMERLNHSGLLRKDNYQLLRQLNDVTRTNFQAAVENVFATAKPENLGDDLTALLVKEYGASEAPAQHIAYRAQRLLKSQGAKAAMTDFMAAGGKVGEVSQYSLRIDEPLERYINAMSNTYASTVPDVAGGAPKGWYSVLKEEALKLDPKSDPRHRILLEDYATRLVGIPTSDQAMQMSILRDTKFKYIEFLNRPFIKGLFTKTKGGTELHGRWLDTLSDSSSGIWSPKGGDRAITELLYHGTLGFSLSAPMKNLSQTILGTLPIVGPKATAQGMFQTLKGIPKYRRLYKTYRGQGLTRHISSNRAFSEAYPDFHKYALEADPTMAAGVETEGWELTAGLSEKMDDAKFLSMSLFRPTERFNRLVAWNAGKARAAVSGMHGTPAHEFAAELVRRTQFPSGVLGTPRALLGQPGWLKQYMQFPLRQANLVVESTRYGGEGRNLGTLGRMMLASGVTYEAGKHLLGLDLSEGLMTGAMPQPTWEGAPFFPAPLVPPAVGVAGAGLQSLVTGDYSQLPRSLSILLPGGLAAHRAYRSLSPNRADYHEYAKTGKIPLYDKRGFLTARYTPLQLFMKSLGIKTTKASKEQELSKYLLAQKEKLRDFRRQYLQAIAQNDMPKAEKIAGSFRRQYPELGPLQVKKSDIKAYRNRIERTRVQRIIAGLPKEAQPLFQEVASIVQANEFAQALDDGGDYLQVLMDQNTQGGATPAQVGQSLFGR